MSDTIPRHCPACCSTCAVADLETRLTAVSRDLAAVTADRDKLREEKALFLERMNADTERINRLADQIAATLNR